jgi:hypothetical protein
MVTLDQHAAQAPGVASEAAAQGQQELHAYLREPPPLAALGAVQPVLHQEQALHQDAQQQELQERQEPGWQQQRQHRKRHQQATQGFADSACCTPQG